MKELISHIEQLLLSYDCVIIPQFGGFVTSNVSARYIEEENLFLPPMRTIGFNDKLKADDHLLLNSFMSAHGCDETTAHKKLGQQIRELQQELWENGACDLGHIGILSLDEYNSVHFSPCQAGVVCPSYYGLDALSFKPIQQTESSTHQKKDVKREVIKEETDNVITIKLKKSWLHNAAAVAAVIIMFFMITPDVSNSSLSNTQKAEFANMMVFNQNEEAPICKSIETSISSINEPTIVEKEETIVEKEEIKETLSVTQDKETIEKGYCIVVASAVPKANAIAYIKLLERKGYAGAKLYKKSGMMRVVFPGYSSEEEARTRLKELNQASNEFSTAWIHYIK